MTLIAAIRSGTEIIMGCDSALVSGEYHAHIRTLNESKILIAQTGAVKQHPMLLGFTGAILLKQAVAKFLTKYQFNLDTTDTPLDYLQDSWVTEIAHIISDSNLPLPSELTTEGKVFDGTILIAYRGYLFSLQANMGLIAYADPYHAIGAGDEAALGALAVQEAYHDDEDIPPQEQLRRAMVMSSYFCTMVREPFHLYRLTKDKAERL